MGKTFVFFYLYPNQSKLLLGIIRIKIIIFLSFRFETCLPATSLPVICLHICLHICFFLFFILPLFICNLFTYLFFYLFTCVLFLFCNLIYLCLVYIQINYIFFPIAYLPVISFTVTFSPFVYL